ncbi:hypothetical protein LY78DRAFT_354080 [Colletotrichum sublineola]|nr:hypothetical protein LY78DRAFT_354080 [Colletotrichum sublineola]
MARIPQTLLSFCLFPTATTPLYVKVRHSMHRLDPAMAAHWKLSKRLVIPMSKWLRPSVRRLAPWGRVYCVAHASNTCRTLLPPRGVPLCCR